jgi:hypothetical protein
MGHVRVQHRSGPHLGGVLAGAVLALVMILAMVSSITNTLYRPSAAEVSRQETAAHQQAALDGAWRPWLAAAENLALMSLCAAVPIAIGLSAFVVIRRTLVRWPVETHRIRSREQPVRKHSTSSSHGDTFFVPARSRAPAPLDLDAA